MRIVLDTNIIVSRYLTPQGRVARIVDLWEQDAFELLASEVILKEYARVLRYPRLVSIHHLTDTQLAEIDEAFREFTELVVPDAIPTVVKEDPDDDHFLACAVSGEADSLVTGDPHLLRLGSHNGIPIHSPADFLALFFPE
ncbi:MAG: putative toxin-antitoxin system toxin component, PIN family [Chloroflexia bacterium]|nr:putative toxin-antitoxin system toxin component, PIN family [Chloroflexia bacterium]